MTTSTATERTYAQYAAAAAENYQRDFVPVIGEPFAQRLLAAARLTPGERVLDVACGTGVATRLAADRVRPGGTVAGLDPTPGMLAVARRVTEEAGTPVDWHQGRAEEIPLPDASFDAVLCALGFMFFEDKPAALRQMRRVLVPGGRVALCTPGPTPALLGAIADVLAAHVGPQAAGFVRAVFSVHDGDEVTGLLTAAGFEQIQVQYEPLLVRVPLPAEFFWQYVNSTPLLALVAPLDAAAREALERDVVDSCRAFVSGDSSIMEPGALVVVGHRPGAE